MKVVGAIIIGICNEAILRPRYKVQRSDGPASNRVVGHDEEKTIENKENDKKCYYYRELEKREKNE